MIYLTWKYSGCINWQVVTAITLILTLAAIVGYTIETGRLRRATVRHSELSMRPFLVIDFDERLGWYVIRNLGKGHAVNIKVEDIPVVEEAQIIYNFPQISLITPDASAELIVRVQNRRATRFQKGALYPRSAVRSFDYLIKYEDLNKKQYQTKGKIGKGGPVFKSTE